MAMPREGLNKHGQHTEASAELQIPNWNSGNRNSLGRRTAKFPPVSRFSRSRRLTTPALFLLETRGGSR